MKANRSNINNIRKDVRGAVGIGTMIVFIATILVAATAAAVLIDTSGKLQEKSQKTGSETTKEVASNLIVKGIYGKRNTSAADHLNSINVSVALAPGANSVDLSEMVIRLSDGGVVKELTYNASGAPNGAFLTGAAVRDDDSSYSTSSPVMTAGDLVNIKVNLTHQYNLDLKVREDVSMTLIPEVGAQVIADFATPASFGTDTIISLR